MPAHENGTIESPSTASSSDTAPSRPGSTMPGWVSSKAMPRMPPRKSSVIRFGIEQDVEEPQLQRQLAPLDRRPRELEVDPLAHGHAPVALREERGEVVGDQVDHVLAQRLLRRPAARAARAGRALGFDRLRGGGSVAPAALGQEAHLRLGVVDQLRAQIAADVAAAHVDRRGGAGVRGGHHGREVAGLEYEEAGARGSRAARGDVRDDRDRRAQLGLRDLAHGREQAARRVDLQHDRVVVRVPSRMDLVDHPVGRDGVDVRVQYHDAHMRRLGGGTRCQRECGEEGHGQEAQCAHRGSQPTPGRWRGRDAETAREAGVVRRAVIRILPAVLALLVLAPAAAAAPTRYGELRVDVPGTPGVHVLAPQRAPFAFDLLGARWRARPGVAVDVRARGADSPWSRWTRLDPGEGGPVSHAEPVWLPGSDALQLRVRGAVGRIRIALVAADRSPLRPLRALQAAPDQPEIVSRAGWGADEALKRAEPRYASSTQMVFVHHTDTPNGYSAADVPAIVRSIYTYHVRSNGWNDIGYNFLVDAYGRVFEGRAGGIDKPVIGAQTGGFNTGSVGIAVIGDGGSAPLTAATRDALTKLIAWRLDVAHVDPLGRATLISGGNDRYPAGKSASFRVVSGHRDALSTDCPGALIYPELDAIAAAAQAHRNAEDRRCERDSAGARDGRERRARADRLPCARPGRHELVAHGARCARPAGREQQRERERRRLDLERRAVRRHRRRAGDEARLSPRCA